MTSKHLHDTKTCVITHYGNKNLRDGTEEKEQKFPRDFLSL